MHYRTWCFAPSIQSTTQPRLNATANDDALADGLAIMRPPYSLLIILIACAACSVTTEEAYLPSEMGPSKDIYIVDHGLHSGIIIEKSDLPCTSLPEKDDFPRARYLEFGWGDQAFYQAKKPTLMLALRALFTPTLSVLYVVGIPAPPEQYYRGSDVMTLQFSKAEFDNLVRYISDSFERDEYGRSSVVSDGPHSGSRFYLATGKYHAFNTCNTWTENAIRSANMPINQ